MKLITLQIIVLGLLYFNICSVCWGFHVAVQVKDDNGKVVEEWNEEKELSNPFSDERPFRTVSVQDDRDIDSDKRVRFKRSYGNELITMTAHECTQSLKSMKEASGNKPVQLVYILEPNDNIKISCDVCGNEAMAFETITWKRLSRQVSPAGQFYDLTTVKMDMHDDESRNRVYVTDDIHTSLILKNVSYEDAGTYFCLQQHQTFGALNGYISNEMTAVAINTLFTTSNLFNFYYHVDVLPQAKIPAVLVSRDGTKYPRALKPYYDNEFVYYSDWGKWSPCSVCGEAGERKRHGVSTVKFNPKKDVTFFDPVFVYHLLKSVPKGIPCQSTLFANFAFKKRRPDEIMFDSCNVECQGPAENMQFSGGKIGKVKFKGIVPERKISVTVGDKVELECLGATLDTMIYWINGTKYVPTMRLLNLTSRRAEIDVYGVFRIHSVELADEGTFSCWHHDIKKVIYKLKVNPIEDKGAWKRHFKYLCLSFFADFWLFLITIIIKFKNRRVQISVYSRQGYKNAQDSTTKDITETRSLLSNKNGGLDNSDKGSNYSKTAVFSDKQNKSYDKWDEESNYSKTAVFSDKQNKSYDKWDEESYPGGRTSPSERSTYSNE